MATVLVNMQQIVATFFSRATARIILSKEVLLSRRVAWNEAFRYLHTVYFGEFMWTMQTLASFFGAAEMANQPISSFRIDSRNIAPGDVFFALEGLRTDGHCHLRQVKERGGIAAIVSTQYAGDDFGLILLRTNDVRESLHKMAALTIETRRPAIAAITGSVGKTTTKEFLATLLSARFCVGKTENNFNSQLTMPLSVLNMRGDEEVLVLEMGMSEPGEIAKLVAIAPPDVAILTKVGLAHVGSFADGIEGIAREKGQLFCHPKTKWAVFDQAFIRFPQQLARIDTKRVSFSLENKEADYALTVPEGFVDERGVRAHRFDLPFFETHLLHDFLAAIAAARCFGITWEEIERQVPKLKVPKMRFESFENNGVLYINDAYNANPDSMKAALRAFSAPKESGKRIGVLGSMIGLGSFSHTSHEEIGKFAQSFVDYLLVYGEEAKALHNAFCEAKKPSEYFVDKQALAKRLKELACPGDAVLIKASRAMEMEQIFDYLEQS